MLPQGFKEKLERLLGEEYPALEDALSQPPVRGVRINRIKTDGISAPLGATLTPLSYADNGYILDGGDGIGTSPEHHAGMIYVQDPGAMATVNALDVKEGWWVLDACAAPGGKSSQLAEKIGTGGFLLSNEYVPKRAKILVGNLERLGVTNAVVTSLDTAELPKLFSEAFDLVLCDAPCSGEGMFRKNDEAREQWSEENVKLSAKRQGEILERLAPLVKCGGYLLYSTCTYSPEENEMVIDAFLTSHGEFCLMPVKDELISVTADGVIPDGSDRGELAMTRRFYPHKSPGEGQYIALLQKREKTGNLPTILYKEAVLTPSKSEAATVTAFLRDTMSEVPRGRLIKQGDYISLVTHDCPIPPRSVFMPGVLLGEIKKGVFHPHHHLFSAFGALMKRKINLTRGDARVNKYLRGEEIDATEGLMQGFCAVCYEGAAIGGGKCVGEKIKNHYPKGLRNN